MNHHFRALRANFYAYRIILSYWKLHLLSKLFGKAYFSNRIDQLHQKNALRLKHGITNLGGLFIKVGQLFSILSNFLPEAFKEPLESLQDQLPAKSFDKIKATIQHELRKNINELFIDFEHKPIGTASVGQTHRATLLDGSKVVVKVQHTDIQETAKIDLAIIKSLVSQASWFFAIKGLNHLYEQVKIMIEEELDYQHEAMASIEIANNLRNDHSIIIPKVFEAYSSSTVLTTAYFDGVKITNHQKLDEWKINKKALAGKLVETYCKMIFEDDTYHADPHPGNILVNQAGEICVIDFGAVAKLSPSVKLELPKLIIAVTKQDTIAAVESLRKMGFVGPGQDATMFAQNIIQIGQDFLHNEIQIDKFDLEGISIDPNSKAFSKLLKQLNLKELSASIQIPKDWILLQRAILLILGTANQLSPDLNPIEVIKPYLQKMIITQGGGWRKIIIDGLKSQVGTLVSLPNTLKRTLDKANKGELQVHNPNEIKALDRINKSLRLLSFSLLMIGAFVLAHLYQGQLHERYFLWGGVLSLILVVMAVIKK